MQVRKGCCKEKRNVESIYEIVRVWKKRRETFKCVIMYGSSGSQEEQHVARNGCIVVASRIYFGICLLRFNSKAVVEHHLQDLRRLDQEILSLLCKICFCTEAE